MMLAAAPVGAAADAPACPAMAGFPTGFRVLKVVHVVKREDGRSDFVDEPIGAEEHAYFKPGEIFRSIGFGAAQKVQLVSGRGNVTWPCHGSLGYGRFLTIEGSSSVVLPEGREREAVPGTLVVMGDMGPKLGHAGRTGPCGYTSLQIVPVAPLPRAARGR